MSNDMSQFFQSVPAIFGTVFLVIFLSILYLGIIAFYVICMWKIFVKAGRPGWAAIIPFYNIYLELEIVGLPWWLIFLIFVPGANAVVYILIDINLATVFGKSTGFAVGLIFLSFVFIPILAFDSSTYTQPVSTTASAPAG
jgi:hypothetical protein